MPSTPLISVITPAYNEEALLGDLLRSIGMAISTAGLAPDMVQVIVADNASSDGTARIAREHGASVVEVTARGIARARNGGATAALASTVCFVDADSQIHPETFSKIRSALENPDVAGGSTGVTVECWSMPLRILWVMTAPARWMGIDAGVVFCRREAFMQVGGYRDDLLVAEDIDFLWRIRRYAHTRKQRLVRLSGVESLTSTRKFDQHGHWRFLSIMARLALLRFLFPQKFLRTVWRYWYEDR